MFNKFNWEDRFTVKVAKMDNQHKVLINYINKLAETMDTDDYSQIQPAFTNMANYVVEHFKEEEAFFDSHGFPGAASHKLIHKKLLETVAGYDKQIREHNLSKSEFYDFLKVWLTSHIVGIDQKYGDYVTGVKKAG